MGVTWSVSTRSRVQPARWRLLRVAEREDRKLLKPVDNRHAAAKQAAGKNQLKYKIAVYGSFVANIMLASLQLYGAV